MQPIAFQRDDVITGRMPSMRKEVSPGVLAAIALTSGVIALIAVRIGFGSWMVPGTAFVIWCLSGWRLFFADTRGPRVVRILGYLFLSTGLLVGAAIIAKLYLIALGPPWIL